MQKWLILPALLLVLSGCTGSAEQNNAPSAPQTSEQINKEVIIPEHTQFLTMDDAEKEAAYKELDQVDLYTGDTPEIAGYSQIMEIDSDEAYQAFLEQTHEKAALIYLAFDECPFCKAFTPKLNQLASELNVPIYYYNVREREGDANFIQNIATYQVQTVPQVFKVENGEPTGMSVNNENTMAEIEAFIAQLAP